MGPLPLNEDWLPELPIAEWLRPVLALPIAEIRIEVTIGRPPRVQDPLCSIVRGLLGQRLRAARCLTGAPTCAGCTVRLACDYARIFEGEGGDAPHPFWLQGIPAERTLRPGASFAARLRLGPPGVSAAGAMETALRDALRMVDPEARLSPMTFRCKRLGDLIDGSGRGGSEGRAGTLPQGPLPQGPLHLVAETPLALRGDAEVCERLCPQAPWLALLLRAGVRRIDALVRAFAPPPGGRLPRVAFPDLTGILVRAGGLVPWDASRFSHRQERRLPLTGLIGAAVLEGGATEEIAPLLQVLSHTSVGKATGLGLGNLGLRAAP